MSMPNMSIRPTEDHAVKLAGELAIVQIRNLDAIGKAGGLGMGRAT